MENREILGRISNGAVRRGFGNNQTKTIDTHKNSLKTLKFEETEYTEKKLKQHKSELKLHYRYIKQAK